MSLSVKHKDVWCTYFIFERVALIIIHISRVRYYRISFASFFCSKFFHRSSKVSFAPNHASATLVEYHSSDIHPEYSSSMVIDNRI